jgi:pimeloyl-ACP methyl ester carboxylesterase
VAHQRISRRAAICAGLSVAAAGVLAGAGYGLVEAGELPGRYQLAKVLGACGSAPPPPAGPLPVRHTERFWSEYRHRQVTMVTLVPARAPSPHGLGAVVALHGLGGDAAGTARSVARAMAAGQIPEPDRDRFAVITVDGGTTYWHRRADGDDPQDMIIHEVLPRAAALGLATARIGIVGESMGGYGALLLAERLGGGPATISTAAARTTAARAPAGSAPGPQAAAVAAISPAIFASYPDARHADSRSFDGSADFAANNVFTQISALRRIPAFIACGTDDPFAPQARLMRERLTRLTGHPPAGLLTGGCHDVAFWARNLPAALAFLSTFLP